MKRKAMPMDMEECSAPTRRKTDDNVALQLGKKRSRTNDTDDGGLGTSAAKKARHHQPFSALLQVVSMVVSSTSSSSSAFDSDMTVPAAVLDNSAEVLRSEGSASHSSHSITLSSVCLQGEGSASHSFSSEAPGSLNAIESAEPKEEAICWICWEPEDGKYPDGQLIGRFVALPCSGHHKFHEPCFERWMLRSQQCPGCRQVVSSDQPVIPVHLEEDQDVAELLLTLPDRISGT